MTEQVAISVGESVVDGPVTPPSTYLVCGVEIAALGPEAAAEHIINAAITGGGYQVHLCNAYTLSLVDGDAKLRTALEKSDLNLADGTPVAWLGRRNGVDGPTRGPALLRDVARLGVTSELHHYLYGAADGVARRVVDRLKEDYPGLVVCGHETPPFRDASDDELDVLCRRVERAGADVLWVALGTPRQDYLVPRLAERLSCVVIPVGAAFNFLSGEVSEAPGWLYGSGLEWLYRLASEPSRLWRRYLVGNPRFVLSAVTHRRGSQR